MKYKVGDMVLVSSDAFAYKPEIFNGKRKKYFGKIVKIGCVYLIQFYELKGQLISGTVGDENKDFWNVAKHYIHDFKQGEKV